VLCGLIDISERIEEILAGEAYLLWHG